MRKIDDAEQMMIAEGRRVLFGSGYAAINVKQIAAACNTSTGTFYSRFKGKKDFALQILAADCRERAAHIEGVLSSGLPIEQKLRTTTTAIADYRRQTCAVFLQIPLEPEENRHLNERIERQTASFAKTLVDRDVPRDRLASGMNLEDVQSFIAQFFASEATCGAMPFESFISCLSSMIGEDTNTRRALRRIVETDPGNIGIYLYRDGLLERLYTSPHMAQALGVPPEKYREIAGEDALGLVLPQDRALVDHALASCIADGEKHDVYCRLRYREKQFDWVHGAVRTCGEIDRTPVLIASFSSISIKDETYQEILDNTDRFIYVCDYDTYEILYANAAVSESRGKQGKFDITAPCYKSIRGNDAPCPDCHMHEPGATFESPCFHRLEIVDGADLQVAGRPLNWCGRKAYVHYIDNITPLRQAERDAVKHREMYEAAVEDAKLVVWEYDIANHRIIMSNNDFTKYDYRKFSLPKIIENAPQALVPYIDDDSVEAFLELYRKVDAGAPKASCEVWYKLTPGQEPRCERISYTTAFDSNGRPTVSFGIGQNITAGKIAEARYEQAYNQLSKGLDTVASFRLNLTKNWVGDGRSDLPSVLEQQKEGNVDAYFAAFAQIIADDELKEWFYSVFSREKLLKAIKLGEVDYVFEYPVIYDDGTRHWSEGHLHLLQNPATGDIEGTTFAVAIDDRKYSELMAKVFSNAMFGFTILLDLSTGKILFGGQSGPQASERYRNEDYTLAMKAALKQMMQPEDLDAAIVAHSIENIRAQLEHNERFELTLVTKDGRHLRWNIAYADRDEAIVLIVREDVTDTFRTQQEMIGRLEEALNAAERASQSEQTFLSNMSHDMRTPLNGILGFTDLALKTDDSEHKQEYLQKIDASGKLMLDLINDVLDMSTVASGKLELHVQALDAHALFDAVVDSLKIPAEGRGLALSADMDQAYPRYILADRLRLQQIALNLLSNAIKYTPDGGTVTFGLHVWESAKDPCNTLLVISDTGIGMSKEFQKRMFEPFAQEHQSRMYGIQGTGLGLSIVSNLVSLMGGRIEVKSALGKGTTFSVFLPLQHVETGAAEESTVRSANDDVSGRRILLVEDNELNREIAETILRERGKAKVECAMDGRAGVDAFEASDLGYFDAIVMDIRMPVMDGLEATRVIRSLERPDAKTVPIIAMTADAFAEDVQNCLDAGMNAHVSKPIRPELLFQTLADQISRH